MCHHPVLGHCLVGEVVSGCGALARLWFGLQGGEAGLFSCSKELQLQPWAAEKKSCLSTLQLF